jgi:geranylgeranyl pyrophosphate synthase
MLAGLFESVPGEILDSLNDLELGLSSGQDSHNDVDVLLQKTVLSGGKRVRPLLTFLMADFFGASLEKTRPYARIIELLHAASLSHDDVIDNATTRRSMPSINIVSSNKKAVLSGDFLFAEVIVAAAEAGHLELVKEIAQVIKDLSSGEWLQLDLAESRNPRPDIIEEIALKKTASVMSWCCVVGPYLSERLDLLDKARDFGIHLGLAFQMVDDTLDYNVTSQKDFMIDLDNGIVNSVGLEWLINSPENLDKFKRGEEIRPSLDDPALIQAIKKISTKAHVHLNTSLILLNEMSSALADGDQEKMAAKKRPLELILNFLEKREF